MLRASLICDGRSIPLLSHIVPSAKQQNAQVQKVFLNTLRDAIAPDKKVIIVTDAGFQNAWFRHIRSLGWDFMGRVRWHALNMLSVTVTFMFIKKRLKGEKTSGVVAVSPDIHKSVTDGHQQKSRG